MVCYCILLIILKFTIQRTVKINQYKRLQYKYNIHKEAKKLFSYPFWFGFNVQDIKGYKFTPHTNFHILLHTKAVPKLIGYRFCTSIIFRNPIKNRF